MKEKKFLPLIPMGGKIGSNVGYDMGFYMGTLKVPIWVPIYRDLLLVEFPHDYRG